MNEHGKTPVQVSNAPAPVGPYSQAVKCGEMIYLSGQLGLGPTGGELVGPTAAAQAQQALENVKAILEASSSGLVRVVKTTLFLTDIADFPSINKVYADYFPFEPPARTAVQVAALPKGAKVEIEVVATLKKEASQFG